MLAPPVPLAPVASHKDSLGWFEEAKENSGCNCWTLMSHKEASDSKED